MTKKEYCLTNKVCAVYSFGYHGLEIHGIEYGIDDYVLYSETIGEKTTYHRRKVYYTLAEEARAYFMHGKMRIYLDECIRTNFMH